MLTFLDINTITRKNLTLLFKKLSTNADQFEAIIQYYQFLENLKEENFDLYQYMIGLLYIDNYRLLTYRDRFHNLSEAEQNIFEIYQQIQSIDDLIFAIEQDPSLLHTMAFSSIKFQNFNRKGKASILMCVNDDYAMKFNKYTTLEKENIIGNHSIDDLLFEYQKEVQKKTDESSNSLKAQGANRVVTTMKILFNYNLKNHNKLVLTMLLSFYKFKKYIQFHFPNLLFEPEIEIIEMIENLSIDEVIYELSYNENLFQLLVEEVLEYEVSCKILDKQEVENFFEKQVSQDVKIKLKEV